MLLLFWVWVVVVNNSRYVVIGRCIDNFWIGSGIMDCLSVVDMVGSMYILVVCGCVGCGGDVVVLFSVLVVLLLLGCVGCGWCCRWWVVLCRCFVVICCWWCSGL